MKRDVVGLEELDRTQITVAGGKGALLGELSRIDGVRVPAGFCVTTDAFRRITADAPAIHTALDRLSRVARDDREAIRSLGAELRERIEEAAIPDELARTITRAVVRLGEHESYAVRSSATVEDLPTASSAGQHDSYLNVVGPASVLAHVRRCWASLFTDRAVAYRLRNGIDHRRVEMAVVVQRMVPASAAGVVFTADPVTGDRRVATVEAGSGLGDALVSGRVNADAYAVREGHIVRRTQRQPTPSLTDDQVLRLVELGRRIETHVGQPQDIEWCLDDDGFQIVQSRAITTLFPIPDVGDGGDHVYVCVGHGQMMTDPMTPLGLSVWKLTTRRPMYDAGGRLFVDVTRELASPTSRAGLLKTMGTADPLIGDALRTVLARGDVIPASPDEDQGAAPPGPPQGTEPPPPIDTDPAIVTELIEASEASLAALKRDIRGRSGPALLDVIRDDIQELQRILFDPRSHQVIMAAMESTWRLNERLHDWLGERNAADTLAQSAPGNVTSEMGLALLDVADAIRPHPEVVAFLRDVEDDRFLDDLPTVPGGHEAREAILVYLDRYGMRCVGEIDITRPRWAERPSTLLPLILSNVRNFPSGAAQLRFARGQEQAQAEKEKLLGRLRALPDGDAKADEAERMIDRIRTFIGYREYPKYHMVSRYAVYRQALLEEAERLVQGGVLRDVEDIAYLTFEELDEVVRTRRADGELIRQRQEAFRSYQALTPPRVITSHGEVVTGAYRREDAPEGALLGLPVSAGTVEGRARVVHDVADADLDAGDILVTAFTDPSWTPSFVAIAGLVTEVGGLMTHGAVIAREYGLPAVVGVEHATALIHDGQRIRVNGTDGYVEILPAG